MAHNAPGSTEVRGHSLFIRESNAPLSVNKSFHAPFMTSTNGKPKELKNLWIKCLYPKTSLYSF